MVLAKSWVSATLGESQNLELAINKADLGISNFEI